MKKLFSIFLVLCLLLPVLAAAEELATPTDLCDHEWVQKDGRSVCSKCGALNPCTVNHEEDYEVTMALYDDSDPEYEVEDDCWHDVIGMGYVIKRCYECGAFLGREDDVEVAFPDFHNYDENHTCTVCGHVCTHSAFEDGRCIYCGFECPHEELSHEVAYYAFGDYEITYTPVDGTYHRVSGTGTEWDECTLCHAEFNVQEEVPLTELEEHWFEEGDAECGFCHFNRVIAQTEYDEARANKEIEEAAKELLDENTEAEAEVITAEDGTKTVILTPEAKENGDGEKIVSLAAKAEELQKLADANVTGITLKAGKAGVILDVAEILKQLAENEGAELIIELEQDPKPDEPIKAKIEEEYTVTGDAILSVRKVILKKDDTETEVKKGVTLVLETENREGMRILYVSEDGFAAAEAIYAESADEIPGHFEIAYLGAGDYLPAIPKTAE